MFFNKKNKCNWGVKSNFENCKFLVSSISKFAIFMTKICWLQTSRLILLTILQKEFEFHLQNFITSFLRNLIFQPSEAQLSSIWQSIEKSLKFLSLEPLGLTNFECANLKFHTLKYHNWSGSPTLPEKTILNKRPKVKLSKAVECYNSLKWQASFKYEKGAAYLRWACRSQWS